MKRKIHLLLILCWLSGCAYAVGAFYPAADPVFGLYPIVDGMNATGNLRPRRGGLGSIFLDTTKGMSRSDVQSAQVVKRNGAFAVEIIFKPESISNWGRLVMGLNHGASVGGMAFVLNGEVICYSNPREQIFTDRIYISYLFPKSENLTKEAAETIATAIMTQPPKN